MSARSQLCTACGQRWPQRDARFCGRCGAMLDGSDGAREARGPHRAVAIVARVGAVIAVVAAIATVSTIDLSRAQPDTLVEVDEDLTPGGPPLSAAERRELREQADPRQLRCEPRGCELWRLDRREAAFGNGIVMRDDGVLLGLRGYVAATDDGDEGDPVEGGRLLVAIDPSTGDELWERRIATTGSAADWVQLIPAPDGALIVSSAEVISVDDEGNVRWHWRPEPTDRHLEWWFSGIVEDVVLVHNYDPRGDGTGGTDGLTALDVTTGEPLWSQVGAWALGSELIAAMDDDGLSAIHPRTGEVLWERAGEELDWSVLWSGAPWVVTRGDATLHLLDPDTGEELASLGGGFVSPVTLVGDLWVGVLRDEPQITPAGGINLFQLVAIDARGGTVWTTPIGEVDWPSWDCCPIRTDPSTGTFRMTDPTGRELEYDAATGELVSVEEAPADSQGSDDHPLYDVWRPVQEVEVVWRAEGHRLDIRTADGAVTVTSGYGVEPESFDPIIVSDGRHLIGVQVVPE